MLTPEEWAMLEHDRERLGVELESALAHVAAGYDQPPLAADGTLSGDALLLIAARMDRLLRRGPRAQFEFRRAPDFALNRARVATSKPSCEFCGRLVKGIQESVHVLLDRDGRSVWNRRASVSERKDGVVMRPMHLDCALGCLPTPFIVTRPSEREDWRDRMDR